MTKVAAPIVALGLMLLSANVPAGANGSSLVNGDFETGASGDTVISGWTAVNERIDLGGTTIAGCTTVDTSDYSTLRDWSSEWENAYGGDPNPPVDEDPVFNNDSLELNFFDGPEFYTELENGQSLSQDFETTGLVAKLSSYMDASPSGYVVHGPAIYSDTFTATTLDDLELKWAAADEEDDFHVFGYLLNTADCSQTEVIDATGSRSLWETVSVAVPIDGTYRFVFVAGTFDQSFGGVGGAYLYLDDIKLTGNQARAGDPIPPAISYEGPVGLQNQIGSLCSNGSAVVSGDRLDTIQAIYVGDKVIPHKLMADGSVKYSLTGIQPGSYQIKFWIPVNGLYLADQIRVRTCSSVPPAAAPGPFLERKLFSNYQGDSGPASASQVAAITAFINQYSEITKVTCVGSSSGVPAQANDVALAEERAKNACDLIKKLVPEAQITLKTSTGKGIGPKYRSVMVYVAGTN